MVFQPLLPNKLNQLFTESRRYVLSFHLLLVVLLLQKLKIKFVRHMETD